MESLGFHLTAIDFRDPMWIAIAYFFGFTVWQIGLPPLVGFLFAGFTLHSLGAHGGNFLSEIADLGVTLLLFTIGLKLNVRQLLRPEVWGVATVHLGAISIGLGALLLLLGAAGIPLIADLDASSALLLGFALSFSSTVFAVKVFEERGGMGSQYGRVSIGVLIVQDIAAVGFLAASTAKLPSPWALILIAAMLLSRPLLGGLLKRAGHGELLVLFGLVMALGGSVLFEVVGLKGDLGALFAGVLLAQTGKASELAKSLLSLKDLFLVGFFLSIGMTVEPTLTSFGIALLLLLIVPLKGLLFFLLFSRFRLRTRQASFASLALANYSEFGLIVCTIAVSNGWLSQEWLVITALAVVMSFVFASPLNSKANAIYRTFKPTLEKLEHHKRLPEDEALDLSGARFIICGMGRIGSGAYKQIHGTYGDHSVVGIDQDEDKFHFHVRDGHHVIHGDSSNPDFWKRIVEGHQNLQTILLCMPNHQANMRTTEAVRAWGFQGHISAVVKYPDEEAQLRKAGANSTFNMYAEVGSGFAQEVITPKN